MQLKKKLIRQCIINHFGYSNNKKTDDFTTELERILEIIDNKHILSRDKYTLLKEFDLPTSILWGMERENIITVADLKVFILLDEKFQKTGIFNVRNVGKGKTKDIINHIPGLKEFCELIK